MNIFGHHFSPASQNRFRQLIKTEKQKNIHSPPSFSSPSPCQRTSALLAIDNQFYLFLSYIIKYSLKL
jgi:hypothetical protein